MALGAGSKRTATTASAEPGRAPLHVALIMDGMAVEQAFAQAVEKPAFAW